MTLVVYHNRVLYADNQLVKEAGTRYANFYPGKKMFADKKQQVAMALCGDIPHASVLPELLGRMLQIGRNMVARDRAKESPTALKLVEKNLDELLKDIPGRSERGWLDIYCITNKHVWHITNGGKEFTVPYEDMEVATGSGKAGYNMCRSNGLTTEEAFKLLSTVDITVGKEFSKVAMSDLNPFEEEGELDVSSICS